MKQPLFIKDMRRKAGQLAFGNLVYNWSLGGGVPDELAAAPADLWPGDIENGRWLCGGAFSGGAYWEPDEADDEWLSHMHGFEWLRDLRALGGDAARIQARGMLDSWLARYESWHGMTWRPDIAGSRIGNWIALYDFYGASAEAAFQERLFDSLIRQSRHIARVLPGALEGLPLLRALRGLIIAGIAFRGRENWLAQGLDLLQEQTQKQILPDGGHISRSPDLLCIALRLYIDMRSALVAGGYPVPGQVQQTIDRMAQALRFFRYADRGLALFHGAQEGNLAMLDAVSLASNAQGKVLRCLPHSGYERITLGRSLVMMDVGAPAPYPHDGRAHAAPLAFEFSYGRERVLISCGSHPSDPSWRDALRATAAHNTAGIDARNACEIREDGHFGRRPRRVTYTREESRDAVLIDAAHDGYMAVNGITHRRRLMLSGQGHDLRGEENFTCSTGLSRPVEIALRFHLHPRVLVSPIRDGEEALLRLPGGAGWRFVHGAGAMTLENSLYLGDGARPRKTKQLVIRGTMDDDHACIKWALQREGR